MYLNILDFESLDSLNLNSFTFKIPYEACSELSESDFRRGPTCSLTFLPLGPAGTRTRQMACEQNPLRMDKKSSECALALKHDAPE